MEKHNINLLQLKIENGSFASFKILYNRNNISNNSYNNKFQTGYAFKYIEEVENLLYYFQ